MYTVDIHVFVTTEKVQYKKKYLFWLKLDTGSGNGKCTYHCNLVKFTLFMLKYFYQYQE